MVAPVVSVIDVAAMACNDDEPDLVGHDLRSVYVERFWLGTLGPSSTWLLGMLAYGLGSAPTGFVMNASARRTMFGGERFQRNSAFAKAVDPLTLFPLALTPDAAENAVRRFVPWLTRRNLVRLPLELRHEHLACDAQRLGPAAAADEHRRRRNRRSQCCGWATMWPPASGARRRWDSTRRRAVRRPSRR